MKYYSTNNKKLRVDLKQAVLQSLALDNGLYMPENFHMLPQDFFNNIENETFQSLSFRVAKQLIGESLPEKELEEIIYEAINFSAPVQVLSKNIAVLELWHGPSLAFKDFGARFMSRLLSYFIRGEDKIQTILVATSGDTGGAVAAGFHNTPGIEVIILYPKGKVSDVQEKQLTTWGDNITALEIDGTFDDCQSMVKQAFLDKDLNSKLRLSSANSINIARLIPQSFYYFEAFRQTKERDQKIVFSVPSGNFGNLTAGIFAKKLGLPIEKFIASTNINNVVPEYLSSGVFQPKETFPTISNAMDVGNPSNFVRIMDLYGSTWNKITEDIYGHYIDDTKTIDAMLNAFTQFNYITDPHGAIAYDAVRNISGDNLHIFLETAHPCKFKKTVEQALKINLSLPSQIVSLNLKKSSKKNMLPSFLIFKDYLLQK